MKTLVHDPHLITGWAYGMTVLWNTWKNIIFPSNPPLSLHHLSKMLNFKTNMTSKWVTYWLQCRKHLSLVLAFDLKFWPSLYFAAWGAMLEGLGTANWNSKMNIPTNFLANRILRRFQDKNRQLLCVGSNYVTYLVVNKDNNLFIEISM